MTARDFESYWAQAENAFEMLTFLLNRGLASPRKLRLFACACCRHVWHLLPDEASRHAVAVAERLADRLAGEEEVKAAVRQAVGVSGVGAAAATRTLSANAEAAAMAALELCFQAAGSAPRADVSAGRGADVFWDSGRSTGESAYQRCALRDIFDHVFWPARVDPAWLAADGGIVRHLAQSVYRSGAYGDLPVLADALEEAGCADDSILSHCRADTACHVRGCWVIDALLGRA